MPRAKTTKRPTGRPTKYDPKYCKQVVEVLKDGYSIAGFAAEIGVSVQTIYNWMQEYPAFFDAVKDGQTAAARWWEERIRQIAAGGDGNATAAIFGLKNRLPSEWRDKTETEITGKDGGPVVLWQQPSE